MASSRSSVRSPSLPDLYGSETPRIFTPPLRKLTPKTSLGFALIEFADEVLGMELLPWQRWLAVHALELLPDGTFRFRTVVLLVARQSGKSTFLQVLALFFLYVRGVQLVIGTAQNLDIAEEVWQGAVDIAQNVPELAAEIDDVVKTNGKKALRLGQGERYKVQAASRRGGRGLSGDLVMLDELREHQKWDAWGAITKTTMARQHAQVWAASNAGDAHSVVLAFLRALAHASLGDPDGSILTVEPEPLENDDDSLGLFEWSAPPGCDIADRAAWAQANPSLGYTITERAIRSALRTDPEPVFRTEVLCQWVDDLDEPVITDAVWLPLADPSSKPLDPVVFAVAVTPSQDAASISIAGRRADGLAHVETIQSGVGTGWVVDRLAELASRWHSAAIVLDSSGPAGSLLPSLNERGVDVTKASTSDYAQACGAFYDAAANGQLRHLDDPVLTAAVRGGRKRPLADRWAWGRKGGADITPLESSTLALWALPSHRTYDLLASIV